MKTNFNVYHFFAGAFVPFWLLSWQEIGTGAKLTYAMLAQQANSRGVTQLHFQVQAMALGEDEGQLARHLTELEESGAVQPAATVTAAPPRLLTEATAPAQTSLLPAHPAASLDSRAGSRGRRRGRGRRQPQSKHAFEVCLRFVTYQREVLHHDHIWSVMGLSRHLHLSGEQDDEIDAWLAEQASNAA